MLEPQGIFLSYAILMETRHCRITQQPRENEPTHNYSSVEKCENLLLSEFFLSPVPLDGFYF